MIVFDAGDFLVLIVGVVAVMGIFLVGLIMGGKKND
jgi:hypothetical protein